MVYELLGSKESPPKITAPNLDLFLDADRENKIVFGIAGGAMFVFLNYEHNYTWRKRKLSY